MPRRMKTTEFKRKCLEAVDDVARTGEPLVVTRRGKAVVRIVPVDPAPARKPTTLHAIMKGLVEARGDIISPVDVRWNVDT